MRRVRFLRPGDAAPREGILENGDVIDGGAAHPLASVRLLAPSQPTKIVCVGRNYREHAQELGNEVPSEPLLFLKPPSAVLPPDGEIVYPPQSARVDYEGELAVVIGARCRNVRRDRALRYVRGFTAFNDVTARDLQKTDGQWSRAKGFDTFAPFGPCVVDDFNPANARIRTLLNGEVKQDASTSMMIFDVPFLIEYISAAFTLEAGDVIATGTPSGIGPMRPGDEVRVEIEGIGALVNRVVAPA
jgi:2-keto-4-pentenoate hydratase/2-oxohepta-3-ene-1,7-dioic acid hydratase in catechol pathway